MRIRSSPNFREGDGSRAATRIEGEDAVREAGEHPNRRVDPQPSEHERVLAALPATEVMHLRTLYRRTETGWLAPLPSRTKRKIESRHFAPRLPSNTPERNARSARASESTVNTS